MTFELEWEGELMLIEQSGRVDGRVCVKIVVFGEWKEFEFCSLVSEVDSYLRGGQRD